MIDLKTLAAWSLAALALVGCAVNEQNGSSASVDVDVAPEQSTLIRVIDGDTIVVSVNGEEERVRLVGIDTPEKGACGFEQATEALLLILGSSIVGLLEAGVDDRDRYGRLLRYLEVDGIDPGLELIRAGLAEAAYDSRSGFPKHYREDIYIRTNDASSNLCAGN